MTSRYRCRWKTITYNIDLRHCRYDVVHKHYFYGGGVVLQHPEEQPEFPIVTRKYFVQFMFLEDSSANQHELLDMVKDQQQQIHSAQSHEQVQFADFFSSIDCI